MFKFSLSCQIIAGVDARFKTKSAYMKYNCENRVRGYLKEVHISMFTVMHFEDAFIQMLCLEIGNITDSETNLYTWSVFEHPVKLSVWNWCPLVLKII